jgi:hypothetical protein
MAIRDSLLDFPLHPLLPFMATMGTLAGSNYCAWWSEASWLPWQLPRMVIRDFPFHPPPSSSPLITMAIPTSGQWFLTYPTDPYYPELLPTKLRPISMPHNTLSSWLHPGYKNWAAISRVRLLLPCFLVNLTQECTLNKACFKPICFIIWLQFGLSIRVNLTHSFSLVLYGMKPNACMMYAINAHRIRVSLRVPLCLRHFLYWLEYRNNLISDT